MMKGLNVFNILCKIVLVVVVEYQSQNLILRAVT